MYINNNLFLACSELFILSLNPQNPCGLSFLTSVPDQDKLALSCFPPNCLVMAELLGSAVYFVRTNSRTFSWIHIPSHH